MEQRVTEVLSGDLDQRVNQVQLVSPELLDLAFQDWLVFQGQLVSLVRSDQLDQRVSLDHRDLQEFLDLRASRVLQASLLLEKRVVQISSVLSTAQQELKAHRDCRESRDTKDVPVLSEILAALEDRAPREKLASLGSRASQDLQVPWV